VAEAVQTSLGPRGMDKMIVHPNGEILITNDGATILKQFEVSHPCGKMVLKKKLKTSWWKFQKLKILKQVTELPLLL
jgi:chaperonin GroEL (HSP60 family)